MAKKKTRKKVAPVIPVMEIARAFDPINEDGGCKLSECPMCRRGGACIHRLATGWWHIRCVVCFTATAACSTVDRAIFVWNTRDPEFIFCSLKTVKEAAMQFFQIVPIKESEYPRMTPSEYKTWHKAKINKKLKNLFHVADRKIEKLSSQKKPSKKTK